MAQPAVPILDVGIIIRAKGAHAQRRPLGHVDLNHQLCPTEQHRRNTPLLDGKIVMRGNVIDV